MSVDLEDFRKMSEVMVRGNSGDHFHALGISVEYIRHGGVIFKLRYHRDLVGNPDSGVVHGGAITALLDSACGLAGSSTLEVLGLTPTVDLRIDYMRPAVPGKDIYAEAEVYRTTSHVIFTRGIAYQDDKNKPIAHAVGNFVRMGAGTFDNFRDYILTNYNALPAAQPAAASVEAPAKPHDGVISELLMEASTTGDAQRVIDAIPYARLLGVQLCREEGDMMFHLPPKKANIGNPTLPAIHGGALGGFMEMSAIFHLMMAMDVIQVPKVIDFSIDFVRAGLYRDTYAKCEIVRFGRKMVNIDISAWQEEPSKPIARARGQFLIS